MKYWVKLAVLLRQAEPIGHTANPLLHSKWTTKPPHQFPRAWQGQVLCTEENLIPYHKLYHAVVLIVSMLLISLCSLNSCMSHANQLLCSPGNLLSCLYPVHPVKLVDYLTHRLTIHHLKW